MVGGIKLYITNADISIGKALTINGEGSVGEECYIKHIFNLK